MRLATIRYIALMGLLPWVLSCESPAYDEKGAEAKQLAELYAEIETLAKGKPCTDALEWSFTPIGSKPCGGPSAYIAYSTQIDTEHFLNRVALYDKLQKKFNEKWGVSSDCAVVPAPTGVQCVEGEAQFIYVDSGAPDDPEDPADPADSLDTPNPADSVDTPNPADSIGTPDPTDSVDAVML